MSSRTESTSVPAASTPPNSLSGKKTWTALVVVLCGSFMDLLDANIVTVATPAIATELHASEAQLQWILAGYILALGSGLIIGGRIGDDHGRRRVFLISLGAFALTSAACALAVNPPMLIGTRALQGLSSGLMVPQVLGIIRSSFPPAAMAKAFAAFGVVTSMAVVAGPLLGGFLVDADPAGLGWRSIFWVNVPIAAVVLTLGVRVLPESATGHRTTLDFPGAALAALATFLLLLPMVQGRDWGWPWWGFAIMTAGVLLLAMFVVRERTVIRRGEQPLLDPALLRIRRFSAGLVVSLFFFGAIGAFFLTLSLYLQAGTGRTAWETGLVILPYAVGSILTSGIGAALAAKMGRALLICGSLILAGSQCLLWLVVRDGQDPGYWALALGLFAGGLGLGLASPILVNIILTGLPEKDASSAGGVLSTVNQLGGAAGIAVIGTVFFSALDSSGAGASRPPAYGDAFATILPIEAALYVATAALMLLLPRTTTS